MKRDAPNRLPSSRLSRNVERARRARRRRLAFLLPGLMGAAVLLIWFFPGRGPEGNEVPSGGVAVESAAMPAPEPAADAPAQSSPEPSKPEFTALTFPSPPPSPPRSVKLPTLMFHHVGEAPPGADETRTGLTVSAADFEAMMSYLKQAGYQPVSQTQLFKSLFQGTDLPPQPVLLTFDDGYLDNYEVAAPILEKYGFTATMNVVTDKVGTPEYISWEQVTALEERGMDIGSHTCSHPDLTTLSAADLRHELFDSAAAIQSHLGHPVYWLCYPAGEYDDDVTRYARDAGYLLALTTEPGEQQSSDAPYAIMRYRVRNDTGLEGFKELVR